MQAHATRCRAPFLLLLVLIGCRDRAPTTPFVSQPSYGSLECTPVPDFPEACYEDYDAEVQYAEYVAEWESQAKVTDANLTAVAGFSNYDIPSEFWAMTEARSIVSDIPLVNLLTVFQTIGHKIHGKVTRDGITLPSEHQATWVGFRFESEHEHGLDCHDVTASASVSATSEHAADWVVEVSVSVGPFSTEVREFSIEAGPVTRQDAEACPTPESYKEEDELESDDGESYTCLVRFWHYGGEVYKTDVLFCWKDQ